MRIEEVKRWLGALVKESKSLSVIGWASVVVTFVPSLGTYLRAMFALTFVGTFAAANFLLYGRLRKRLDELEATPPFDMWVDANGPTTPVTVNTGPGGNDRLETHHVQQVSLRIFNRGGAFAISSVLVRFVDEHGRSRERTINQVQPVRPNEQVEIPLTGHLLRLVSDSDTPQHRELSFGRGRFEITMFFGGDKNRVLRHRLQSGYRDGGVITFFFESP